MKANHPFVHDEPDLLCGQFIIKDPKIVNLPGKIFTPLGVTSYAYVSRSDGWQCPAGGHIRAGNIFTINKYR